MTTRFAGIGIVAWCGGRRNALLWAVVVLLALLVVARLLTTAVVTIRINVASPTTFAIYWAGENQNYSESRVSQVKLFPHRADYTLRIGNLSNIRRLRIDPATGATRVRLHEIDIRQHRFASLTLVDEADFKERLQPLRHVASYEFDNGAAEIGTDGNDPQLEWHVAPESLGSPLSGILLRTVLAVAFLAFVGPVLLRLSEDYAFVPYAMLLAFSVIAVMATDSRINAHPDEYVHLRAAEYYVDHAMPPRACDENTLHTYSPYGVSRLNSTEIAYFLSGKFASVLEFLPLDTVTRLRYFNVFLFGLLLVMCMGSVPFRLLCVPLLLSPQIWYVFSYVNSEAIAIFAGMTGVYQLAVPGSGLRRLLEVPRTASRVALSLGLGVLVAILLLVKTNFFLVSVYLLLWFLAYVYMRRDIGARRAVTTVAPIMLVALALVAGWFGMHEAANDFEREERVAECRRTVAKSRFSEAAPLEQTGHTLYWRDKGRPFTDLFESDWGKRTFESFVGNFGYLEIQAASAYYVLFAALYAIFACYVLYVGLAWRSLLSTALVLVGVALVTANVGASMWNSWVNDFQAQGRYLFPAVPIIALLLATIRSRLDRRAVTILTAMSVILSLYFFVFVGLANIRPPM